MGIKSTFSKVKNWFCKEAISTSEDDEDGDISDYQLLQLTKYILHRELIEALKEKSLCNYSIDLSDTTVSFTDHDTINLTLPANVKKKVRNFLHREHITFNIDLN